MINNDELNIIKNTKRLGKVKFKKSYPDLYEKIIKKWPYEEKCFSQKVHHYFYNSSIYCGGNNLLEYGDINEGYSIYCREITCDFCNERKKIHNILTYELITKPTCIAKLGVDNPFKLKEFQDKAENTRLEKYGYRYIFSCPEFREKAKNTTLEKYGVDNVFKLQKFQDLAREIIFEKYGVKYWHSEVFKNKSYHNTKYKLGIEQSILLLQIFEDEWIYKTDIVKKIIINKINPLKYETYEIKKISNKLANSIHIKNNKSTMNYGLYINDELIDCLSYNIKNNEYYITKFPLCFHKELFSIFDKNIIINGDADLRFFENIYYEELGFQFIKEKPAQFKYAYQNKRLYTKQKEIYPKIYDAGYFHYKLNTQC